MTRSNKPCRHAGLAAASGEARVNWQVSHAFRLGVGYRWLDQDYETGSGSDAFASTITA